MKKSVLVILGIFVLLALPIGFFSDSGENLFLGMVILDVAEEGAKEVIDVGKPASPEEPKKIEVKEEVKEEPKKEEKEEPKEEVEPKVEEVKEEVQSVSSSSSSGSSKKKRIPSCSDFIDNNINYYKQGTCKDKRGKYLNKKYPKDYCDGDKRMIMEFSCGSDNLCEGSWYVCPNGCKDGACISDEDVEELKPDLNLVNVEQENNKVKSTIKNIGTKSTDFKVKFSSGDDVIVSEIDYSIKPGELLEVELEIDDIDDDYSVEVLSEEDENKENNVKEEEYEKKVMVESEITGQVVNQEREEVSFFEKIKNFLRGLFL